MGIKELTSTLFEVLKKRKYFFISLAVAIVFYAINIFLANFRDLTTIIKNQGFFYMLKVFPLFVITYKDFFTYKFFIGLIVLSLLFGILISLISYKTKMLKDFSGKRGFLTSTGIFLGIIAPGCSACGVGFISAIGFGSAIIAFLPWKGFELILVAIFLLSFSVYKILKDITKGIVCEIPKIKKK